MQRQLVQHVGGPRRVDWLAGFVEVSQAIDSNQVWPFVRQAVLVEDLNPTAIDAKCEDTGRLV